MRNSILYLFLALVTISCNNVSRTDYRYRDSALAYHFNVLRKLPFYDTTVVDYKLLKAAYLNDTNFFINYFKEKPEEEQSFQSNLASDSCLHLPKLSELGVDEAYRFTSESYMFSEVVDGHETNISSATIAKKGNDVRMQIVRGEYLPVDSNSWQRVKVAVHYKRDKILTLANWDSLQKEIRYCDYWGLKLIMNSKVKMAALLRLTGLSKDMNTKGHSHIMFTGGLLTNLRYTDPINLP